ncbi:MAG: glycosyltransferase family 39 protein [Actinobacteria bacterium]|nr:glycosyltransferase family 39 protein [Actinomycetota bacterium]MCG2801779.1 glycosyltransferase family 39 protein [Cellulomonas sp.]
MVAVGAVVAWFVLNAVWVKARLDDRALNIDEAGYLSIALNATSSWRGAGLSGWWATVSAPSQQAPLVTTLTSVPLAAGTGAEMTGMTVILAFGALAVLFTWLAARDAAGNTAGWVAALIVATCPGFLLYAHQYTFVAPTTALLAAGVWTLGRSRALSSWPWSLAFGVIIGVMPLARSMSVAFSAVLAAAALVQVVAAGGFRQRVLRWAVSCALGVAITLTWLLPSWDLVIGYLTQYGYGKHAAEYATALPGIVGVIQMLSWYLFIGHFFVITTGVVVVLYAGVRHCLARASWGSWVRAAVSAPAFISGFTVLGGLAALSTTRNAGSGFPLQLIGPLAVVAGAGWSIALTRLRRPVSGVLMAVVVLVCLLPVPGLVLRDGPFGTLRTASLPVLGDLPVTDGADLDEDYIRTGSTDFRNEDAWSQSWRELSARVAADVVDAPGRPTSVAFGFRNMFFNVNTVQLQALESGHSALTLAQVDPQVTEPTAAAYAAWLTTGGAASACTLVTSPGQVNEFQPRPDSDAMTEAAESADFVEAEHLSSPDGRSVVVWHRETVACGAG